MSGHAVGPAKTPVLPAVFQFFPCSAAKCQTVPTIDGSETRPLQVAQICPGSGSNPSTRIRMAPFRAVISGGCVRRPCSEIGLQGEWRRGWDSNPRYRCRHAAFRVRCFRPLSHLSARRNGAGVKPARRWVGAASSSGCGGCKARCARIGDAPFRPGHGARGLPAAAAALHGGL